MATGGSAPPWSPREFEILLGNYLAGDRDLAGELPGRTVDAIRTVRRFVHHHHTGGDVSGLGGMMLRRLGQGHGTLTGPTCRAAF